MKLGIPLENEEYKDSDESSSSSEQEPEEPTTTIGKARRAMRDAADFAGLVPPKGWARAPKEEDSKWD